MLLGSVANGTLRDFSLRKHMPGLLSRQMTAWNGNILPGAVIHPNMRV